MTMPFLKKGDKHLIVIKDRYLVLAVLVKLWKELLTKISIFLGLIE